MISTTFVIMTRKYKHQKIMLTQHYTLNISLADDAKYELSVANILYFHPHSVNIAILQRPWDAYQQKCSIDLQPCNSFVAIYFPLYKMSHNCMNSRILKHWIKRILVVVALLQRRNKGGLHKAMQKYSS